MLICIDTETTGLCPTRDVILEIGMLAIDTNTFREVASYQAVIRPEGWFEGKAKELMDDYVTKMHAGSGLLKDIAADEAQTHEDAVKGAIAFYHKHAWGIKSPMMGANPEFDRGFLKAQAPDLAKLFHYRNYDVNTFWLTKEFIMGKDAAGKKAATKHRSLDDCRQALRTVHDHFDWLRGIYEKK